MSNYNDAESNREYDDYGLEDITPENCVMYLTQAWINERASPDILQYEQAATDEILSKIEEQTAILDDMDSGNDTTMIISILYQTELERVKFVLRSYLRTRISKIERFCDYIISNEDGKLERLSAAERTYAQNYLRATKQHYHNSFLSSLPQSLQLQNDVVFDRRLSMVSKPNMDEAVFCKVVSSIRGHQVDGEEFDFEPGQIYIFRYGGIYRLVEDKRIVLI